MKRGRGLLDLKVVTTGFGRNSKAINDEITGHINSTKDNAELPIILIFDRLPNGRDPRRFTKGDYVRRYINGEATPVNTSTVSGIYRVADIRGDDVYYEPATTTVTDSGNTDKTKCALLRKFGIGNSENKTYRLIIMVLNDKLDQRGGAKSSRRRKMTRRSSRSKSVNKKRKYTQQRIRRRSHRR